MQAIFGLRTTADINLVIQLVLLAGLIVGFFLARAKRYEQHGQVQTAMVLLNLIPIALAMIPSFYGYVVAGGSTTGRVAQLMIGHGVLGLVVEFFAIYLILRMRTRLIPERWRIKNIKLAMRTTLALWALLVALGVGIYVERYLREDQVATAPLAEFRQLGADLYVHAVELDDAVKRGSQPAIKRHAEHLINLIEGDKGLHYGDNDTDGHMEDPGDGVGLLARLSEVTAALPSESLTQQDATVRSDLDQIVTESLNALGATSVADAEPPAAQILELAQRANGEGIIAIDRELSLAGVQQAPGDFLVATDDGQPATANVSEIDFAFLPREITIPAGTTVIWVNDEQPKHTATADDGAFDSGDQGLGDSFSYTFAEPGNYPYFCRYHGDVGGVGMAGVITVQ
jgi:plastocyanin